MTNIPIFLASDNNYAPFIATAAYSILDNTSSFIDFYILDGGISTSSKHTIKTALKKFKNFSIEYVDMEAFALSRFPSIKHYSTNAFSRYFIPEIKPELDKVLYLDVDIIVKDDIAKLYNQDLDDYPLGAVLEDFYNGNYTKLKESIYPDYNGGSNYFNSGILLIKPSYFKENNIVEKLINLTIELSDKLSCADQDVLNIVFENNFKALDYRFNYMPDHFNYLKNLHPDRAEEVRDNAVVLHFTAGKPWLNKSINSEDFWKIAHKVNIASIIKEKFPTSELPITFSSTPKLKKRKFYLFGFIPFMTLTKRDNGTKIKFLGIPLFKITKR